MDEYRLVNKAETLVEAAKLVDRNFNVNDWVFVVDNITFDELVRSSGLYPYIDQDLHILGIKVISSFTIDINKRKFELCRKPVNARDRLKPFSEYVEEMERRKKLIEDSDFDFNTVSKSANEMVNNLLNMSESSVKKEEKEMKNAYMSIKDVIFNDPATIVFWEDGTKTVVKRSENDTFDPEKGFAMAICKKLQGNKGSYYNEFKKWLPKEEEAIKKLNEAFANGNAKEKEVEKTCSNCIYLGLSTNLFPCKECQKAYDSQWAPKKD